MDHQTEGKAGTLESCMYGNRARTVRRGGVGVPDYSGPGLLPARGHRWSDLGSHMVREMRRALVALNVTCRLEAISLTDWRARVIWKRSRFVCAVRRFEIFLLQTGGTRERFLSYQLTRWRKPNGTRACWESGACPEGVVGYGNRMARPLWIRLNCLNLNPNRVQVTTHRKNA